jgi:hypothetical protein
MGTKTLIDTREKGLFLMWFEWGQRYAIHCSDLLASFPFKGLG